jgi:hypothetical protein
MRDPRTTPAVGDVLRKRNMQRTVTSIAECGSGFLILFDERGQEDGCWLNSWHNWAKDAEVVALGVEI